MFTLLRQHRYEVKVGSVSRVLRIEELVSGPDSWGGVFRLVIAANGSTEAQTVYGATADEVAHRAAELINEKTLG